MVTLIMGGRGCGKSTWARNHLGEHGLCYDMDAIASAFRLRMPHEEYCDEARHMANDLLPGWLQAVHEYTDDVYVIRTAPTRQELEEIMPDRAVVCLVRHAARGMDDPMRTARRLADAEEWLRANGVPIRYD